MIKYQGNTVDIGVSSGIPAIGILEVIPRCDPRANMFEDADPF